jgi:hypothetical protein
MRTKFESDSRYVLMAGPERFELSAFGFGGRCPDPC